MREKSDNISGSDILAHTSEKILKKKIADLKQELRLAQVKHERAEKTLSTLLSFFSGIPYAINVTADNYTILYANKASKNLLGTHEVEGKFYPDFFSRSKIPPDTSVIDKALASGEEQHGITTLPDGSATECLSTPITLTDGRKAVINMYLDIGTAGQPPGTAELMGLAVRGAKDSVLITDVEGNIVFANDSVFKLTGFSKEELLSSSVAILLPPELMLSEINDFLDKITSSSCWQSEINVVKKGGKRLTVQFSSSPIKDVGKKTVGVVCVLKDISLHKSMQTAIAQEQKKLASLISSMHADICQIGRDMQITWANKSFEQKFGELSAIRGEPLERVVKSAESFADCAPAKEVFENGKPQSFEWQTKEGAFSACYLPIFDEKGETKEVLMISLDISEHKKAERVIRRRNAELKVLLHISVVSEQVHELGTLFSNILPAIAELAYSNAAVFYELDEATGRFTLIESHRTDGEHVRPPEKIEKSGFVQLRRCVEEKDICILNDLNECQNLPAGLKSFFLLLGIKRMILLPIKTKLSKIGAVILCYQESKPVEDEEILLLSLARQIGTSIDRIRLFETIQGNLAKIKELQKIGYEIASSRNLRDIFTSISDSLVSIMGFSAICIRFTGGSPAEFFYGKNSSGPASAFDNIVADSEWQQLLENAANHAIEFRQPQFLTASNPIRLTVNINNMENTIACRSVGIFPMVCREKVYGTIEIFSHSRLQFDTETNSVLSTIISQAAMAIENANLIEHLERTMEEVCSKEKFLNNIIENSADGILVSDVEGIVIACNRAFTECMGYTLETVPSIHELLLGDPTMILSTGFKTLLEYITTTGPAKGQERKLRHADGSFVPIELSMTVYRDDNANPAGVILIVRDIRERQALQEQLFQTEKLSALGEVISSIAHELNNPLTGVIGFAELLAGKGEFDADTCKMLNKIMSEANRCKKIVSNLLWFSRKHPSQQIRVNINSLIDELIELKEYEFRVSNIEVKKYLAREIPDTVGDPYLLQQVFFNIVNNAHQAMTQERSSGILTISAECNDEFISIRFSDTGPGIPKELQSRIFDPFFTTKLPNKGTGLGLSLSYKIIERHGGNLGVESSPGEGATFVVTLPIISPSDVEPPPAEEKLVIPEPRRGRILIVDDEQSILDLLTEILRGQGHIITTTSEASEAMREITESNYNCIISDLRMPGMDGKELYNFIIELKPETLKKLLFITGDFLNDETEKFIIDSGIPCIEKPFTADDIFVVVNQILAETDTGE